MALKRYDEVLGSCDAYLAGEKPTVEVLEIRGLARLARQDYSGAIADYTPGPRVCGPTRTAETRTRLLNHRGWAYHFADAPGLALDDFEASLKLDKDQSDALAGRGLARVRLGEWRPAVADAEAALRLADAGVRRRGRSRRPPARPTSTPPGSTPRPSSSPPREVSREGERAVSLYRRYRARALELLERGPQASPRPGPPPGVPRRPGTPAAQARARPTVVREPRRRRHRRAPRTDDISRADARSSSTGGDP